MTRSTRPTPPAALAARLVERLKPVLLSLGWQHDSLALEIHDLAERLACYTAAATAPLGPELRARYRGRALAAAGQLEWRLELVHRMPCLGAASESTSASKEALAGLVRAMGGGPIRLMPPRPAKRSSPAGYNGPTCASIPGRGP